MSKYGSLLSLTAGLILSMSSAGAVTIFSVTGSPDTCASSGGNAGDRTTGIVTAEKWSQSSGYSNVTISAALDNLFSSAFTQFTAYLTTSSGAGTTVAQEIAHATVTAPGVAVPTASLTTIFTGLTLPPGTYFLTIYGDVNGPALGPDCWTFSGGAPTVVTAAGVSGVTSLQTVGVAPYPPASFFIDVGNHFFTQVTGDPIALPTFSKAFGSANLFTGQTTSLTFHITNSNAVALTGLAFSDTLPTGLVVGNTPGIANSCGGTVTAAAGSHSVSLSGGTVAASSTCTISVTVSGISPGTQNNTTSTLTSNEASAAPAATASIVVFTALDGSFQVSYAADPAAGESYINIINTGANGAALLGPGFGGAAGNMCVNVYAFAPDEQEISCCSCLLTPNSVANLGVNRDLTSTTLTGVVPTSVVIKLVATLAGTGGSGTSCTASAAAEGALVNGLVAYGTTPQPVGTTFSAVEHTFVPSTLSAAEYASITGRCASILGNGSGFGICASCRAGALGAGKQ